MTASTTDSAKWAALNSNIGSGVVGNPASIEAALDDVRAVVDQHATEIDGKLSSSGGAVTGDVTLNNNKAIYLKETGGTSRFALLMDTSNQLNVGSAVNILVLGFATTIILYNGSVTVKLIVGTGSPEGVHTANVGSLYLRTDGAATTTLYVKTSGAGNTGWTAK